VLVWEGTIFLDLTFSLGCAGVTVDSEVVPDGPAVGKGSRVEAPSDGAIGVGADDDAVVVESILLVIRLIAEIRHLPFRKTRDEAGVRELGLEKRNDDSAR
jgi:hypothetical protein